MSAKPTSESSKVEVAEAKAYANYLKLSRTVLGDVDSSLEGSEVSSIDDEIIISYNGTLTLAPSKKVIDDFYSRRLKLLREIYYEKYM